MNALQYVDALCELGFIPCDYEGRTAYYAPIPDTDPIPTRLSQQYILYRIDGTVYAFMRVDTIQGNDGNLLQAIGGLRLIHPFQTLADPDSTRRILINWIKEFLQNAAF